jgi:hypothetical protein
MEKEVVKNLFENNPERLMLDLGSTIDKSLRWSCPFCSAANVGKKNAFSIRNGGLTCFRCGWKGDCFSLMMELHGLDFPKALEAVAASYGMSASNYKDMAKTERAAQPPKPKERKRFVSFDDAIAYQESLGLRLLNTYYYPDGLSQNRFTGEDRKKTFRPLRVVEGMYEFSLPPKPWPLYHVGLQVCLPCFIAEGEKCANVVAEMGLSCYTSLNGASSADCSDWTPVAKYPKRVYILPDNDAPGILYARTVQNILKDLGKASIIISPSMFPEGGDIADLKDRDFLFKLGGT